MIPLARTRNGTMIHRRDCAEPRPMYIHCPQCGVHVPNLSPQKMLDDYEYWSNRP